VGEESAKAQQDAPPDPGAMAAAIFLRGLLQGLEND
jgi:triose/dihydroxyacetone kinase / FAD-AMP lyase (cyclizing)